MLIQIRKGFELPVKIVETVNPFLVIISIIGLFLEYSPLKAWVIPVNQVIDVIFVVDFLVRLISFRKEYFLHGYGWVDLLASIPGITLLLQYTPMFAIFKFVRIGRFFKIIRLLRFLRIFSFLRRMKSESPWIQDRIMKIGISVVLVFVVGIVFLEGMLRTSLEAGKIEHYTNLWTAARQDTAALAATDKDIVMFVANSAIFDKSGAALGPAAAATWVDKVNLEQHWFLEIPLSEHSFFPGPWTSIPTEAYLVASDDLMARHDSLMLILLATVVVLLFIVIFYLGAIFATDMAVVHLVNDSIDADDFRLLQDEARRLVGTDGDFEPVPGENEMRSLLKLVARLTENRAAGLSLDMTSDSSFGVELADGALASRLGIIEAQLDRIEAGVGDGVRATVRETIKASAPAIVRYLRSIDNKR